MVCALALGLASLAKMIPAWHAEMITPTTLCTHMRMTASGHSSVVWREPYLKEEEEEARYKTHFYLRLIPQCCQTAYFIAKKKHRNLVYFSSLQNALKKKYEYIY